MDAIKAVHEFAREFVNGKGRTPERIAIIKAAYEQRYHEKIRKNCITCLIEAIFKIIKPMETKRKCNYELKKGAILQPFGMGIVNNNNLTDDIAEQELRLGRAVEGMFSIMPDKIPVTDNKAPDGAADGSDPVGTAPGDAPGDAHGDAPANVKSATGGKVVDIATGQQKKN